MKLPSIRTLIEGFRTSFSRFPFVLSVSILGTICAVLLLEGKEGPTPLGNVLTDLLMTCALGLPLLLSLALVAEKARLSQTRIWFLHGVGILFLILYYMLLPAEPYVAPWGFIVRFVALLAGFHLLVSVAPFAQRDEISAFWEFNKTLLLRLLLSFFYTHVLWMGLSVALMAIEQLFGVTIKGERYSQLYFVLLGIFNTWFFLSGIPRNVADLDAKREFPKGLKVFTQYVMLPLVLIYLVILYAYAGKILVEWSWPKGWVSYLVLGFSITGIFSLLLVHPIADREENKFIRFFSRNYYRVLAPLAILLFLAIWRRISEYGITEPRYYVLLISLWLAGMIVYFIVSKVRSIKVIPASLCVLAFLSTFGPWGAVEVSGRSQMGRLEGYLTQYGILSEGKVARMGKEVPFEDAKDVSSIVRYFANVQGVQPLQKWFSVSLDTVGRGPMTDYRNEKQHRAAGILSLMGVRNVGEHESTELRFNDFTSAQREAVPIAGYDWMVRLQGFGSAESSYPLSVRGERWEMRYRLASHTLVIARIGVAPDSVVFDLNAFARQLLKERRMAGPGQDFPAGRMALDADGQALRLRLVFSNFNCRVGGDSVEFQYGNAQLLIGPTQP
jgi:hypothetical protein